MNQVTIGNITCTEGDHKDKRVDFHFNPSTYKISKSVRYKQTANIGHDVPKMESSGGSPRTITLDLLFDSSIVRTDEAGKPVQEQDVSTDVSQLFDFMLMDDKTKQSDGKESHISRAPMCRLQWGKNTPSFFNCYVTQCDVTYTLFTGEGIPIRAKANIQLMEALDPKLAGTNPTSRGEPGPKARRIQEGDRLDWIAYEEYGDPNEWRLIAHANHLSDPLNLRPGMILAIPTQ